MKNFKKRSLTLLSIVAFSLPISGAISCNMNLSKNIKDDPIPDSIIFDSENGQAVIEWTKNAMQDYIANKYFWNKLSFSNARYDNWIDEEGNAKVDEQNRPLRGFKQRNNDGFGTNIQIDEQVAPLYRHAIRQVDRQYYTALLAQEDYWDDTRTLEFNMPYNRGVDPGVRNLFLRIKNEYNKLKPVYPIEQKIIKINGIELAQITFQVDLTSSLSNRFLKHYFQVPIRVPINTFPSEQLFWDQLHDLNDVKTDYFVAEKVFNILFGDTSEIFHQFYIPPYFYEDQLNGTMDLINSIKIDVNDTQDKYIIYYQKRQNIHTNTNGTINPGVAHKYVLPVEFDRHTKMSDILDILENEFFINSSNEYVKNLFHGQAAWNPTMQLELISGQMQVHGLTIDDFAQHESNFSKVNVYMANKDHKGWNWMRPTSFAIHVDNTLPEVSS